MNERVRGTIEMSTAMAISGTIGWFVVVSGQPVLDVVFWRCAFGAMTLLVACTALGLLRPLSPRQLALAVLGGLAIVLNWILLFAAFPRASISIATAVYSTQPFMLVLLGALFFSERLTATKLMWLGLSFAGVLLIIQAKPDAGTVGTDYLTGVLLAFGAAFAYAITAVTIKTLTGTPPHMIALVQVLVGIATLAPLANLHDPPDNARTWFMLGTVGVVHTGLMFVLQYAAIQRLPTHLTGSLYFVYPVVAFVVDFLAFGHRMHPVQLLGAAAILIAAAGMNLGWSLWGSTPGSRSHLDRAASKDRA